MVIGKISGSERMKNNGQKNNLLSISKKVSNAATQDFEAELREEIWRQDLKRIQEEISPGGKAVGQAVGMQILSCDDGTHRSGPLHMSAVRGVGLGTDRKDGRNARDHGKR